MHIWTQIVGKIRLALAPWLNHTWQVTLYPTSCRLATGPMPYHGDVLEIAFDFVSQRSNCARAAAIAARSRSRRCRCPASTRR